MIENKQVDKERHSFDRYMGKRCAIDNSYLMPSSCGPAYGIG